MSKYFKSLARIAALFTVLISALSPLSASAAELTLSIQNSHPNAVEVELYSQDREHFWPGGGEIYLFDDGETKEIPITCNEGENICYGAWISGDRETYWGVGPGNAQTCTDCCYTCEGGKSQTIQLTR